MTWGLLVREAQYRQFTVLVHPVSEEHMHQVVNFDYPYGKPSAIGISDFRVGKCRDPGIFYVARLEVVLGEEFQNCAAKAPFGHACQRVLVG